MRAHVCIGLVLLLGLGASPESAAQDPPRVQIVEIVTDSQTDWSGDGRVTGSDEFVELHNLGDVAVELTGWVLHLNDTTPETWTLSGSLAPGERRAFVNPPGEINNNGQVRLLDPAGNVVDAVSFGSWAGNAAGVPDGNANDAADEALRRIDETWGRGHATPGRPPDEPYAAPSTPFDPRAGAWWDPGNRTVGLAVNWTDADRSYSAAFLEWEPAGPALESSVGQTSGRWSASVTATTPTSDFQYRWILRDSSKVGWETEWTAVMVDREAPHPGPIVAPAWTNLAKIPLAAEPAVDEGVGGVEYAFDTAPSSSGPWTATSSWSAETSGPAVPIEADLWIRLRVRDAYANEAPVPAVHVRWDANPPPAAVEFQGSGYDSVRLRWTPIIDLESGIAEITVTRRGASGDRTWLLPAGATEVVDSGFRLGDDLEYEVWAVDRAGNVGNVTRVVPDYEGRYPHASLRVSKPVWGSGSLRLHGDFDRAMDAEQDPAFVLEQGGVVRTLEGRWLANRSTYLVLLDSSEDWSEGEATLRLRAAHDAAGRGLWQPQARAVLVDGGEPTVEWSDVGGWVNETGLRLEAHDSLDPAPRLRYRVGNDTEPWVETAGGTLIPVLENARVTAFSLDASGRRSSEATRRVRVDAEPPLWEPLGWSRGAFSFRITDDGAGVDPASIVVISENGQPGSVNFEEGSGRITETTDPVRLVAQDFVGNRLEVEIPAAPDLAPVEAAPAWFVDDGAAARPEAARSLAHEGRKVPPTIDGGGTLFFLLLAVPGIAVGVWRRGRRRGLLSQRLRRMRRTAEASAAAHA